MHMHLMWCPQYEVGVVVSLVLVVLVGVVLTDA